MSILGSKLCSVSLNVDDSCSRSLHWVIRCHACYSLCRLNACKLPIECEHLSYTHAHMRRFTFSAYNMCKSVFAIIWDWRWVQAHQRKSVINIKQQPTFHDIFVWKLLASPKWMLYTCAFSGYLYVYVFEGGRKKTSKKTLFYFERMVDECIMVKDRKMLETTICR